MIFRETLVSVEFYIPLFICYGWKMAEWLPIHLRIKESFQNSNASAKYFFLSLSLTHTHTHTHTVTHTVTHIIASELMNKMSRTYH